MRRIAGLFLAAAVAGCGTTLPSAESVLLSVAQTAVGAGAEIAATLVNQSAERLELGVLPCRVRIIDQVSRLPIAPPNECEDVAMFFEPGRIVRFNFNVPTQPGIYWIEVPLRVSDPQSESTLTRVQSQEFTVSGPSLAQ